MFSSDIQRLQRGLAPLVTYPLHRLCPLMDKFGILRIGSRLRNCALSYDEIHPVILDGRNTLIVLLTRWTHERALHGGYQLILK